MHLHLNDIKAFMNTELWLGQMYEIIVWRITQRKHLHLSFECSCNYTHFLTMPIYDR